MQDIIPRSRILRDRNRTIPPRNVTYARSVGGTYSRQVRITSGIVEVTEAYIFEPAPMTRPIEHLSVEDKVEVLGRALARAQVELKLERRSRRGLRKLTFVKAP